MSLSNEQWEFAKDVAMLIIYAEAHGFKLTMGEASRTKDQQMLYVYGKEIEKVGDTIELVPGPIRSKTMKSDHLNRLAIDFNIFFDFDNDGDRDYVTDKAVTEELGTYWKSLNNKNYWGGDFTSFLDTPHFGRRI